MLTCFKVFTFPFIFKTYICMLFYILLELENDLGQVEMCFFYRWFSSPKVKNNWIILERNLCWWFSVHWEKDFIWNFQIKVEIIHFKITVHILSYSQILYIIAFEIYSSFYTFKNYIKMKKWCHCFSFHIIVEK